MDITIDCLCPPKGTGEPRHASDTVTLRDRLDFRSATTIRKGIGLLYLEDPGSSAADVLALLTESYLLYGISAWTLTDAKGKAAEPSKAAIRDLLNRADVTSLADAADALYAAQVMLPLLAAAQSSSQPTPTDSTSARNGSPTRRPKRSKPSSTTTTLTGGTARITVLHVGDSSSLPNSKSAAQTA